MTYYAIYFKAKKSGFTGEDYPIIISSKKSSLEQYLSKNCYIKSINSLPEENNICAQEKWCIINEKTFVRDSENKHNLEKISKKNLLKILFNS